MTVAAEVPFITAPSIPLPTPAGLAPSTLPDPTEAGSRGGAPVLVTEGTEATGETWTG